ncbi:MAG TPA: hypothetical protein DCP28_35095 [Cytophagales bacterium]|nr:hypothetical protein [Cytophagales bacterium]
MKKINQQGAAPPEGGQPKPKVYTHASELEMISRFTLDHPHEECMFYGMTFAYPSGDLYLAYILGEGGEVNRTKVSVSSASSFAMDREKKIGEVSLPLHVTMVCHSHHQMGIGCQPSAGDIATVLKSFESTTAKYIDIGISCIHQDGEVEVRFYRFYRERGAAFETLDIVLLDKDVSPIRGVLEAEVGLKGLLPQPKTKKGKFKLPSAAPADLSHHQWLSTSVGQSQLKDVVTCFEKLFGKVTMMLARDGALHVSYMNSGHSVRVVIPPTFPDTSCGWSLDGDPVQEVSLSATDGGVRLFAAYISCWFPTLGLKSA